jgi:hypothetical protein
LAEEEEEGEMEEASQETQESWSDDLNDNENGGDEYLESMEDFWNRQRTLE